MRSFGDDGNQDWDSIEPGDHFVAWTPVDGKKHEPTIAKLESGQYLGSLCATYDSNIWMLQEPFWVARQSDQTESNQSRTENLLVVSRPGGNDYSAIQCLRSVTDVASSSINRGLDHDALWNFLIDRGLSGLVNQRQFQAAAAPVYRFSRSPFSMPSGEFSVNQEEGDSSTSHTHDLPIFSPLEILGQPWSTTIVSSFYAPTYNPSTTSLPHFQRDYRHVSLQLKGDISASPSSTVYSLLMQEAVCFPDQIQNDGSLRFPLSADSSQSDAATSFYPLSLDIIYATDKPGAMLSHALDLHCCDASSRARGLRTSFTMRDPRQVALPPGTALRITQLEKKEEQNLPPIIDLQLEEVLGNLLAPTVSVDRLITFDSQKFVLNPDALIMVTIVGDEIVELHPDSPYAPLMQDLKGDSAASADQSSTPSQQDACLYLVTRGQLTDKITPNSADMVYKLNCDAPLDYLKINDSNNLYLTRIRILPGQQQFSLSWQSQAGSGTDMLLLDYFGVKETSLRQQSNSSTEQSIPVQKPIQRIPGLATSKLGVVTCKKDNQQLDLFASVMGGQPTFRAVDQSSPEIIEISRRHDISWRSRWLSGADPHILDALHVIKYFADGQTLCASVSNSCPGADHSVEPAS